MVNCSIIRSDDIATNVSTKNIVFHSFSSQNRFLLISRYLESANTVIIILENLSDLPSQNISYIRLSLNLQLYYNIKKRKI